MSANVPLLAGKVKQRFLNHICTDIVGSDCWHWMACCTDYGDPIFDVNGKHYNARRLAYRLFIGIIPSNGYVVTTCKKRCCMNPEHLLIVPIMQARKWYGERYGQLAGE